ncbi:uncharacterized protein PAC_07535 [Phialocephala subalpina]|uniref:Uncharacterized protein n=1 Tax=Phialocephala subalpina TaxID=576137 RepID=A0A1L7WY08_9HELO|nr:uncharacterized protein PAC_07535 [Phialocephala subalpina]
MPAKRKRVGAAKGGGRPVKKAAPKRPAREPTPLEEPHEEVASDTGDPTEVAKVDSGWSMIEHNYLFDLVKHKLKQEKRQLKVPDFGSIADQMDIVFGGKTIQEGDAIAVTKFKNGVQIPVVAGSEFPYKVRTANSLHSYAMHINRPNRSIYDQLYKELKARNFEDSDDEEEEVDGEDDDGYEEY